MSGANHQCVYSSCYFRANGQSAICMCLRAKLIHVLSVARSLQPGFALFGEFDASLQARAMVRLLRGHRPRLR